MIHDNLVVHDDYISIWRASYNAPDGGHNHGIYVTIKISADGDYRYFLLTGDLMIKIISLL